MKTCTRCNQDKPLTEYYKRSGKRGNEHYSYCKRCFNLYLSNNWMERKKTAVAYKGGKCHDCGGQFHYAVYDFHHRDPSDKEAAWITIRKWPQDKRERELDKCDMLCANCHRMRHVNS